MGGVAAFAVPHAKIKEVTTPVFDEERVSSGLLVVSAAIFVCSAAPAGGLAEPKLGATMTIHKTHLRT